MGEWGKPVEVINSMGTKKLTMSKLESLSETYSRKPSSEGKNCSRRSKPECEEWKKELRGLRSTSRQPVIFTNGLAKYVKYAFPVWAGLLWSWWKNVAFASWAGQKQGRFSWQDKIWLSSITGCTVFRFITTVLVQVLKTRLPLNCEFLLQSIS